MGEKQQEENKMNRCSPWFYGLSELFYWIIIASLQHVGRTLSTDIEW